MGSRSGRPVTPVQAAIEVLPRNAQEFRGHGMEITPNGNVGVVFSYKLPVEGKPRWIEHVLVYAEVERKNLFEWERISTFFAPVERLVGVQLPYEYRAFQNGYTAFFGQINSEDIAAIEVTFSNDEKVRKNIETGFFLVFLPDGVDICELQFYGPDQQIVDEVSLNRNQPESNQCPRKP